MIESYSETARQLDANPMLVETWDPVDAWAVANDALWDELNEKRDELYAICGVIVHRVIETAMAGRDTMPPLGLSNGLSYKSALTRLENFEDFQNAFSVNLNIDAGLELMSMQIGREAPIIRRLESLVELFNRSDDGSRYRSSSDLIRAGIGTAVKEPTRALMAISRLVQNDNPKATNEEIAAVARRSYGLVKDIASNNIAYLDAVGHFLLNAGEELDPEHNVDVQALEIKHDEAGGAYVDFVGPIPGLQSPVRRERMTVKQVHPTRFRTRRCPALIRFGDDPAAEKLWHWMVDVAEATELFTGEDVYAHPQTARA